MSYAFQMTFLEIPKEKVISVCMEIVNRYWEKSKQILEDNLIYIPSVRNFCYQDVSIKDYRVSPWKETDRFWLKNLFQIEFLYWETYGLLGVCGVDLPDISRKAVPVYFQNSTDQNYKYETWKGISVFEKIVKEVQMLSDAEILHIAESCDDEDMPNVEYYRQTAVYKRIYETLDLESWLWHRNGNMTNFTMGPTKSEVDWIRLQDQLSQMLVLHEFLTQKTELLEC